MYVGFNARHSSKQQLLPGKCFLCYSEPPTEPIHVFCMYFTVKSNIMEERLARLKVYGKYCNKCWI